MRRRPRLRRKVTRKWSRAWEPEPASKMTALHLVLLLVLSESLLVFSLPDVIKLGESSGDSCPHLVCLTPPHAGPAQSLLSPAARTGTGQRRLIETEIFWQLVGRHAGTDQSVFFDTENVPLWGNIKLPCRNGIIAFLRGKQTTRELIRNSILSSVHSRPS